MDAVQLLRDTPLFSGLDEKNLQVLARTLHQRKFAAGEVVFREGDEGVAMYIIASGRAEIYHERDGSHETVKEIGPGEVFGEISVLVHHPRIAAVRALEPTECYVMTAWNFRSVLSQSPEIAHHLMLRLAQWIVDAEDRAAARV